jgi:hypothetical protein
MRIRHLRRLLNLTRQRRWPEIRYQASHYRYALFWLLALIGLTAPWILSGWQ